MVAQLRPKNLIPLAHVEHGWVFGDSLTLFGPDIVGTVQVPIDELDRDAAPPWGVAITPDKSKIFLTTAGSKRVTVIDVSRLIHTVRTAHQTLVNDLSASANFVMARIPVGHNPRGVLLSKDGKLLYVVNRLDDNISVIDTAKNKVIDTIDLGGPKNIDALRRASGFSTQPTMPFRASSAAPIAISMRPSTACNGIWNPMASARTSWITAHSKI